MDQAGRREILSTTIGKNFETLDKILNDEIQANIDLQAPDGPEKLMVPAGMEVEMAEVGNWLGSCLRTPQEVYKFRIIHDSEDFWEKLGRYKNLRLTAEEQYWAGEPASRFTCR